MRCHSVELNAESGSVSASFFPVKTVHGLSAQQRKHRRPHDGKKEDSHSKSKCEDTHSALLKPARSIREEKYCGEQHGVGEVLAGNAAGRAGLLLTFGSLRGRFSGFARPWCFVEFGNKRMRIRIWIFEGLL